MGQIELFFEKYFVIVAWGIVFLLVLIFAIPFWVENYRMINQYRKKEYASCLKSATRVYHKSLGGRGRVTYLTYILSCSLNLQKWDVFLESLEKIPPAPISNQRNRLSWEISYFLEMGNIGMAKEKYEKLIHISEGGKSPRLETYQEILSFFEGKSALTKEEWKNKEASAKNPSLSRIYSAIISKWDDSEALHEKCANSSH